MLSPRNKKYIVLPGFVGLFFIFIFVGLLPLFSAIQKNSNEIIDQKKQTALSKNKIQNFNSLAAEYRGLQQNIDKINSLYIDQKEPLGFINFLETTAKDLELSTDIFINNNTPKTGLPSLDFQINASGSFSNLMKFLEKLESASYLVDINSLSIQKAPEGQIDSRGEKIQKGPIQINLDVNVYSHP